MGGILVFFNTLILREIFSGNHSVCDEGDLVESISAFCYLAAAIVMFFRATHREALEQKMTLFFGLTCLLFFIREIDLEDLDIPTFFQFVGSGSGRDVIFLSAYLLIVVAALRLRKRAIWGDIAAIFRSNVIRIAVVGAVLLLLGSFAERSHSDVLEEILEMNGSMLILLAALLHERIPICPNGNPGS